MLLISGINQVFAQSPVRNTSYVTTTGEKVLRPEVTILVDRQSAWKYFTTDDLLKKWIAPVAHIELNHDWCQLNDTRDSKGER